MAIELELGLDKPKKINKEARTGKVTCPLCKAPLRKNEIERIEDVGTLRCRECTQLLVSDIA
ncbi:phage FluMu protein Com [Lachnospiraceae bacterium PF1-22]